MSPEVFICSQHGSFSDLGSQWGLLLFCLLLGRPEITFAYPPGRGSGTQLLFHRALACSAHTCVLEGQWAPLWRAALLWG